MRIASRVAAQGFFDRRCTSKPAGGVAPACRPFLCLMTTAGGRTGRRPPVPPFPYPQLSGSKAGAARAWMFFDTFFDSGIHTTWKTFSTTPPG